MYQPYYYGVVGCSYVVGYRLARPTQQVDLCIHFVRVAKVIVTEGCLSHWKISCFLALPIHWTYLSFKDIEDEQSGSFAIKLLNVIENNINNYV